MKSPSEEIVQIVDRDNREIGSVVRSLMRAQRLIHRACYIMVFNAAGELFVQKRARAKDIYPGCWDVAAGGVALAGENREACAKRELAEELGVRGARLNFLFDQYFEDADNRVWGSVFRCCHEGPFVLQAEEMDSGCFMLPKEALALSRREPFTPDGLVLLRKILEQEGS